MRASNDGEVTAVIARAAPGDTIMLAAGFYEGGWTLRAGAPGKPITLRAERAGRVFVGHVDTLSGLDQVDGP